MSNSVLGIFTSIFNNVCSTNLLFVIILFAEIDEKVESLQDWLCQMESKMLPLKFHTRWSKKAIDEKSEEIKVGTVFLKMYFFSQTIVRKFSHKKILNFVCKRN